MPVESGTYISDLVATNPAHSDPLSQTDAHIRWLKAALLATFTAINGPVTITDEQLNALAAGTYATLAVTGDFSVGGNFSVTGRISGNGSVPTGAIVDYLQTSIPTGWYELNGQAVSRTGATAALFALYGTAYGAGDGSTTFNLPNLNDYFRRSRGTTAVGTFQAEQIKQHTHSGTTASHTHTITISDPTHNHGVGGGTIGATGSVFIGSGAGTVSNVLTGPTNITINGNGTGITASAATNTGLAFTTDNGAGTGTETRPKAIVVVTCVKA